MKSTLIAQRSDLLKSMEDIIATVTGPACRIDLHGVVFDKNWNTIALRGTIDIDNGLADAEVLFYVHNIPAYYYTPFTLLTASSFTPDVFPFGEGVTAYQYQPFHEKAGATVSVKNQLRDLAMQYHALTLIVTQMYSQTDTAQAQLVDLESTAEYYKGLVYDSLRAYIIDNQGEPIPACRIDTLELVNVYEHGAEVCIRLTGFNTDRFLQAAYRITGAGMGQLVIQQTGPAITPEFFEHCRYTCKYLPVKTMIDISSYARKWATAADALALLQTEARNAENRANA